MASTKIQNLPLKAPIGAMKIPTGGFGDYSITVSSIGDFIIDTFNLATKDYVDNLLVEKEDRIDTTGGFLTPVSQNSSVPDTTNDVIDEVAQALLDRIEYVKDNFSSAPSHNELTGRSATGAHPSTSISHKSGTVYTYLQQNESDINNINNVSIPTINQALLSKQDLIETGSALTPVSAQSPVPSVSHTGLNTALQALLNRTEWVKNNNSVKSVNAKTGDIVLTPSDIATIGTNNLNATPSLVDVPQVLDKNGSFDSSANAQAQALLNRIDYIKEESGISVKNFMSREQLLDCLLDQPQLDHSDAIQRAVDKAIQQGTNKIFFNFDNRERYRIDNTVTIPSSGFYLSGNRTPSYHIHMRGGYIFGNATNLFDYGNGGVYDSNQLVVDGVAGLGKADSPRTQNFVLMNQNNNGPHRGVLFTRTSARGFNNVLDIAPTNSNFIGAATVVFESGCCFTSNQNTANSSARVFGLAVNSIQSEAGARFTGKFDGGVSFRDNMLEGQSNPITIDSNQPTLIMENNYVETVTGDYLASLRGTNANALFDERPNYISSVHSTDIYRLGGTVRLHAPYRYHLRADRYSVYSFIGANLTYGSKFDGSGYVGVTDIATDGLRGFCNPSSLMPARSSAISQKFVGSDILDTPFGRTYSGLKSTGTSPYITVNKSWNAGDVVTAVALVKLFDGQAPTFTAYASGGTPLGSIAQNTVTKMLEGWHIVVISGVCPVASTTLRWRFTSTTEIQVAAIGVDVTPIADFKTFNSVQRAEIQVFNPLSLNAETHTYRDIRTLNIPAISTGQTYTTTSISVFGASVGDAVVCSPNIAMQGLDWFARVSATNTIELEIKNRTGASVTLGNVQWNTRVFK